MTEKTPQKYGLFILQPNIFLFFYCAPSVFAQARLFLATERRYEHGFFVAILRLPCYNNSKYF